jgi:uncharacterized protein
MQVSRQTERRFVLGLQGLWPGRRWKGLQGVAEALRACRRVQVDPLNVVGRNQDLVFASRVDGYRPPELDTLLYKRREAYEFGGAVSIFPRESLPLHYSWVHHEGLPVRWETWCRDNAPALRRVLKVIDAHGPVSSEDFSAGPKVDNYRSSRQEGVALYVLWRRLDVLVHHREGNRKFYDRSEKLFGPRPDLMGKDRTIDRTALETLSWLGMSGRYGISYLRTNEDGRGRSKVTKRQIRQRLLDEGLLRSVTVQGETEASVVRTDQVPLLEAIEAGEVPREWEPLHDLPEAVFLGPLDIVAGRGRAKTLFDFEYLWEVYKPASKRRWGYYVLPVLLGDRLVGRIEPVYDRASATLRVVRAWWEKETKASDIVAPLARGLRRFAEYLEACEFALNDVGPGSLRDALRRELRRLAA